MVPQRCGGLDAKTRILTTMAAAVALQSDAVFRMTLRAASHNGVTPVEIRETLYQSVPYAGMGKAADFIAAANEYFAANGVALPLEGQATTSPDDRLEKGLALQRALFGERIDRMQAEAPENQRHIQRALSGNCFGDYVSRGGLDVRMRELLTFSMLASMGSCEAQLKSHIRGNLDAGSDKRTLLAVLTQLLPYIGYPRTLNAIACLNEVIPEND